jgi:hypothetical protein
MIFEAIFAPELSVHLCPKMVHELLLDAIEEEKDMAKREKTDRKKEKIRRMKKGPAVTNGTPGNTEEDHPSETLAATSEGLVALQGAFASFSKALQAATHQPEVHAILTSDPALLAAFVWAHPSFNSL